MWYVVRPEGIYFLDRTDIQQLDLKLVYAEGDHQDRTEHPNAEFVQELFAVDVETQR